jgi:hypothetical protein
MCDTALSSCPRSHTDPSLNLRHCLGQIANIDAALNRHIRAYCGGFTMTFFTRQTTSIVKPARHVYQRVSKDKIRVVQNLFLEAIYLFQIWSGTHMKWAAVFLKNHVFMFLFLNSLNPISNLFHTVRIARKEFASTGTYSWPPTHLLWHQGSFLLRQKHQGGFTLRV